MPDPRSDLDNEDREAFGLARSDRPADTASPAGRSWLYLSSYWLEFNSIELPFTKSKVWLCASRSTPSTTS